jgi:hypothetical protein
MAIGRISGPMLFRNLERQGVDLAIEGNLIYFDVNARRVSINGLPGNVDFTVHGSANITSNLFVGGSVTVGNLYVLPRSQPTAGQVLVAVGGDTSETYWAPGPAESGIYRRRYEITTPNIAGYGNVEIDIPLGISSIIYNLTVSRPCKVEAFSTAARNDENPYTFIATADHLVDDGTVFLSDGSSFQSRQYSIWANHEEPAKPNIYVTVTSIDQFHANTSVTLSLFYYPAVTDNRPAVDVVTTLPITNVYLGKMVYVTSESKLYVYSTSGWQAV